MPLDLVTTAAQVDGMAVELKTRQGERERRLQNALVAIEDSSLDAYEGMRERVSESMAEPIPVALGVPGSRHSTPPLPPERRVVAVDGSHIAADRHLPARCFLVNTGVAVLTYGPQPDAMLFSHPRLYARAEELVIRDPDSHREQTIDGSVLGAKRTVEEIRALAEAVRDLPAGMPTLAFMDGSLVMLGLVGRGFHDFVLRELIEEGFVGALEELREIAKTRPLALASYISLPGHFEVVKALRLMVCPYGASEAEYRCSGTGAGLEPCDGCVGGLLDREVFGRLLKPGERSAAFASSSQVVKNHYKGNGVVFFYVNVGEEIGRVEVPSWVAEAEGSLELVHSMVVDQCERGRGYAVGLMEAHEQAAITAADRRFFVEAVERALHSQGLPVYTSEKARSKRLRML